MNLFKMGSSITSDTSLAFSTVEMQTRLKMGAEYHLNSDDIWFHILDQEQVIIMRIDHTIMVNFSVLPDINPTNSGTMPFHCEPGMYYFHYKPKFLLKAAHMRLVERKEAEPLWKRLAVRSM